MRHVKRLLVTMLVVAMVLSTAGIASAAIDDVAGTKYEEAVQYLYDLGVVDGRPDGFFPEEVITRAEASKVIIVMTYGSSALADLLKGTSPFPDVAGEHWASGYIMLAKNAGIVNGFEDGTFRPNEPVTYAQFAKMLVEAAGLEPVEELGWPGNYVAAAQAAGMLDEDLVPDFVEGAPAIRGDCAIMASFTVAEVEDPETGRTLAQSVFGLSDVAELVITPATKNVAVGEAVAFTVTAKNEAGEAVAAVPTFATGDGAAISTAGVFVASASGAYTVTATADGVSAEATVNVYGKAAAVRIVPGTAEIPANELSTLELTVEVVDANGFLVANDDSTEVVLGYAADGDNGAVELPVTVTKTVSGGQAKFKVTATQVAGRTDILEAVDEDEDLDPGTCEITSVEQIAATIKLSVSPSAITANKQTKTTVTAQVLDQMGKAMVYGIYNLKFTISGPGTFTSGGVTSARTLATDYEGKVTQDIYSVQGTAGTITVSVSAEGLETATIDIQSYVSGKPAGIQVEVLEDTAKAGSGDVVEFRVILVDAQDRPTVSEDEVDLNVTLDEDNEDLAEECLVLLTGAYIPANSTASDVLEIGVDDGVATGDYVIRVRDSAADWPKATFTMTVTAGDATKISASPSSTWPTIYMLQGEATGSVTVSLLDADGNAVAESGVEIVCSLDSGDGDRVYVNGTKMAGDKTVKVKTDSAGKAKFNISAQGYVGDTYQFGFDGGEYGTATSATFEITDRIVKNVEVTLRDNPDVSSTTGATSRLTAGETGYLHIRTKDQNGNTLVGQAQRIRVTFSNDAENIGAFDSDNVLHGSYVGKAATRIDANTNPDDGWLIIEITGMKAGTFAATAQARWVQPAVSQPRNITVVSSKTYAGFGIETAAGEKVKALEVEANTALQLRVFAADIGGNPIPAPEDLWIGVEDMGHDEEWEIYAETDAESWDIRTSSTGTPVAEVKITKGTLYKTVYFVHNEKGKVTIDTQEVGYVPPPETYAVVFTVEDEDEASLFGALVVIDGSMANTTNSSGQVTFHLENGGYDYTVSLAGYVTESGDFVVAGAGLSVPTVTLQSGFTLETADEHLLSEAEEEFPITVTVVDDEGDPVQYAVVTAVISPNDALGELDESAKLTAADGTATFTYTGDAEPQDADDVVTLSCAGYGSLVVTITSPPSGACFSDVTEDFTVNEASQEVDIEVTLLDIWGEPVVGETVSFVLSGGEVGGLSAGTDDTDVDGKASVKYTGPALPGAAVDVVTISHASVDDATVVITILDDQTAIAPEAHPFDVTAPVHPVVTELVDAWGNNVLAALTADDGTAFTYDMEDVATGLVKPTVTNAAGQAMLVIEASEATDDGDYTLTITRVADGQEWTITVTVEGN